MPIKIEKYNDIITIKNINKLKQKVQQRLRDGGFIEHPFYEKNYVEVSPSITYRDAVDAILFLTKEQKDEESGESPVFYGERYQSYLDHRSQIKGAREDGGAVLNTEPDVNLINDFSSILENGLATSDCRGCSDVCRGSCHKVCTNSNGFGAGKYCNGCSSTCAKDCSKMCVTSCSAGCDYKCGNGCGSSCYSECSAGCASNCGQGCEQSCSTACKYTCHDNCQYDCKYSCSEGCTEICKNGCGDNCDSSCGSSCSRGCGNNCDNGCGDDCKGGCFESCSGKCKVSCSTECYGSCQSTVANTPMISDQTNV